MEGLSKRFLQIYKDLKNLFPYKCFSISYLSNNTFVLLQYIERKGRTSLMLSIGDIYGIAYNADRIWKYVGKMSSEEFLASLKRLLSFGKDTLEKLMYRCKKVDGELSEDNRS